MRKYLGETMTVEQLISFLATCPKDATVYTEGCDCIGEANRCEYDPDDNEVMILRVESY